MHVGEVVGTAEQEGRSSQGLRQPPNVPRPTGTALHAVRDVVQPQGDDLYRSIDCARMSERPHQWVSLHAPLGYRLSRRPGVKSSGAMFGRHQEEPGAARMLQGLRLRLEDHWGRQIEVRHWICHGMRRPARGRAGHRDRASCLAWLPSGGIRRSRARSLRLALFSPACGPRGHGSHHSWSNGSRCTLGRRGSGKEQHSQL